MRNTAKHILFLATVAIALCAAGKARAADVYQQFNNEDIKPYLKIIKGPWVDNTVAGGPGHYRISAKLPRNSEYVIGLFDHKINRTGNDQRSAVVLIDGVNPLAPAETIPPAEIDGADVSWMRKVPFDGLTFNSRDSAGKDCTLTVVDAKEEYEFGPVKPFTIPAGRSGNLGRIDIFLYAAPANPPTPGQAVQYGKPVNRFSIAMTE